MPRGYAIYKHASLCLLAIGVYSCTNGNSGAYCGVIYISAWGSALLVSTGWAFPGASGCEASDSAGLHVFFMPTLLKSDYLIGGSEVLNRLKL